MTTYFLLNSLYELEIIVNTNIQKYLQFAEPFLRNINTYCEPSLILDLWIPLVGALSHKLLVQLVSSLSVINLLATLIKWCSPECRPIWWLKETKHSYDFEDITIDPFSCDTSAGFPSTHAVTFTTFALIIIGHCVNKSSKLKLLNVRNKLFTMYTWTFLLSIILWLSRLYFLHEFLHQCIIGSLFAVGFMQIFDYFSKSLMNLSIWKSLFTVVSLGVIPLNAYFTMLINDVDPFWSVRMAFKWCPDPLYLKHESTPVFCLCRDFGYILGVALSCPLAKNYNSLGNKWVKRLSMLFLTESSNLYFRSLTPKQHGRFIFVAYEFLRNFLHTFTLLTIIPKFNKN